VNETSTLTRELYEGLQRGEFDRWDALVAEDVLVNSPARFGQRGLNALKDWARWFVRLGKQIDLVDEHLALNGDGSGRGFITFNLHWKHDEPFFDVTPTGREGTSVETLLLTITEEKVTRIDVTDNSVDLILYMWQRGWPYPHNIAPEPLVVGVDRRS
jgi:hypothetical protein